jgi:hypothetical protein
MADVNVLIAFYSRTGKAPEVRLRRAREFVSPEIMAKATGWAESRRCDE